MSNIIWPDAQVEATEDVYCGKRHVLRRTENGQTVRESVLEISMPVSAEELKRLRDGGISDEALREVFAKKRSDLEWELTMFKTVSHPNLAPVEDFIIRDNVTAPGWKCFIRSKLYEPIGDAPLDEKSCLKLAESLSSAVSELNRLGMAHGDIRPCNIGVDADGVYVLTGFGVRKCVETPDMARDDGFDAPEVCMRGSHSVLSDIYSIGKTLSALGGDEAGQDIADIIKKATAPDTAKRFQSPSELAAEIADAGSPDRERRRAKREQEQREAKRAKNIDEARAALDAKRAEEARKEDEEKREAEAAAAALLAEEIRKAKEKRESERLSENDIPSDEAQNTEPEASEEETAEAAGIHEAAEETESEPSVDDTAEDASEDTHEYTPKEEIEQEAPQESAETTETSEPPADTAEEAPPEADEAAEDTEEITDTNAGETESAHEESNEESAEEIDEENEEQNTASARAENGDTKKRVKLLPFILAAAIIIAALAAYYFIPWDRFFATPPAEDKVVTSTDAPEDVTAEALTHTERDETQETAAPVEGSETESGNAQASLTEDEIPDANDEPIPEEALAAAENETGEGDAADENVYDMHTDSEYITAQQLEGMDRYESYMVVNSIYARHGKIFGSKSIQSYFEAQSWYSPVSQNSNDIVKQFNDYEIENIKTLVEYQVKNGYRKARR
ncbi:MAG: YARHG domain-containing protein [Oscillospiraceae bacterium]|nr:YARHG domain-containing protein [Oscillospiraceae bacterium]